MGEAGSIVPVMSFAAEHLHEPAFRRTRPFTRTSPRGEDFQGA
jgi:hypothetical protein